MNNDNVLENNYRFVNIDKDNILNSLIHDPHKTCKILGYAPEEYLHFELRTNYAIISGCEILSIKIFKNYKSKIILEINYSEYGFSPFFPPFIIYNPGFIREREIKNKLEAIILHP